MLNSLNFSSHISHGWTAAPCLYMTFHVTLHGPLRGGRSHRDGAARRSFRRRHRAGGFQNDGRAAMTLRGRCGYRAADVMSNVLLKRRSDFFRQKDVFCETFGLEEGRREQVGEVRFQLIQIRQHCVNILRPHQTRNRLIRHSRQIVRSAQREVEPFPHEIVEHFSGGGFFHGLVVVAGLQHPADAVSHGFQHRMFDQSIHLFPQVVHSLCERELSFIVSFPVFRHLLQQCLPSHLVSLPLELARSVACPVDREWPGSCCRPLGGIPARDQVN
mmetsp:Transcript_12429/g.30181  ORF Transcript_12429/g.30181 Transcript_12429/m.30181 type:complete len:273 (-) Transcript_12429:1973-2791(-)